MNVLVGPNNAGKSTILAAFRILAAAMRRASSRKASVVRGPNESTYGHQIDLRPISISSENIFYNYDDTEPAHLVFTLSDGNTMTLYFAEQGSCVMIADAGGRIVQTPSTFKKHFDCPIGFVPILGPVEHDEQLYEQEAARLALYNYRAARNFRNIWHHYPEHFDEFRGLLQQTWPGMDIEAPEHDRVDNKVYLRMYCPEQRIPRELCWSGFGFQVWCQMLTHVVQSKDCAIFLIDEPDIYLHSDLQRQLIQILRNLGPDIVLATHSTEIVTEAETGDLVLINKKNRSARRINDTSQLHSVFSALGSNVNPILTQLGKTRRALFVEGKDFQIFSKFARKLNKDNVGNRRDFAVLPIDGFNPNKAQILKQGVETTLGGSVVAGCILDRDYRCESECMGITKATEDFCQFTHILGRKEIENFILVPDAIDRAALERTRDQEKRSGQPVVFEPIAREVLERFCAEKENYVISQLMSERQRYERQVQSGVSQATSNEETLNAARGIWETPEGRLTAIPGKEALSYVNAALQERFGINVTSTAIISAMTLDEVPKEVQELIDKMQVFSEVRPS